MQYTQQQQDVFKSVFALRRRRQLIATAPMTAAVVVVVAADESTGTILGQTLPIAIVMPVVLVLIGGCVLFAFKNWRCPACNRYLGKAFNPAFCSKCGVALK